MAAYTCISCRVTFADCEVQRAHYKSDWHRYNLKRKVADMPPVSAENFQERVLAQRATAAEQQLNTSAEACDICNKKFSSANAYQNHLQSHKHQKVEKQALLTSQQMVDKMNQKNLEKGLGEEKDNHDSRNEALQRALKEQHRSRKDHGGRTQGAAAPLKVEKTEESPRMLWLQEQVKRREVEERGGAKRSEGDATAEEEEWEDMEEDDEEEEEEEEMEEDEEEMVNREAGCGPEGAVLPGSIPVTDCLFCSHHSKSLMKNVAHMSKVHSFFIPDVDFLVQLRGLLRYLGEKVGAGNVCLWCNEKGRTFFSTEAVQKHMVDKSHCKLFTDGDAALEFTDFYDYRSSYPDRTEDDDDDDEALCEAQMLEYDEDTLELTLPSGAKIGHRSLMRYYRQRFGAERTVALVHNRNAVGRLLKQYKALGWGGAGGSALCQKPKDMRYIQKMKSNWMLKMGLSNNATKQKHFRVQVMF